MTERKCLVFNSGGVEVREREFLLIKGGERLSIEPTAFRVLLFLLRNPGQLVSKEEIVASVWNEIAVSDNSLTRAIAQLRRVLDDDPREARYILTVPTLGYRFLCEVAVREDDFSSSVAAVSAPVSEETRATKDKLDEAREPQLTPLDTPTSTMEHKQPAPRSRKLVFAGAAVAVLLLLVAGFVLRRFIGAHSANSSNAPHLAMEQRLTANPTDVPVNNAIVSPDGKYLAYADPTGLYLRQISSGETRRWSLPKGFIAWPYSWFPDSTHLLVRRVATQSQDLSLSPWQSSLYELSMLGGEPQEIVDNAAAGYVSPDGSRIAYLPMPDANEVLLPKSNELWMTDSDGANPRRIVSVGEKKYGMYPNWIDSLAWSPTGQHLAYIERHFFQETQSLRIIGPNGEGATVILDDPRIGEALWWAPDGRIFSSYREDPASRLENYGVYSIRVEERTGKAAGAPQPVTQPGGNIRGMSGTANGKRLVLWRSNLTLQAFIASFDTASHRWNEPRRLTLEDNFNFATAWTADSKAVLFVSNRNGTWKLFKQAIDETIPEVLAEGRSIILPRLSADGSHVLYLSSSNPNDVTFPSEVSFPFSLMRKPLAGGTPRVVIQGKGLGNYQCARAPSTLCIFTQFDRQDLVFRSFDLEHGAGRELFRMPDGAQNWSLSSDGSKLAIILDRHRIRFVSLGTGAAHEVTVKDWPLERGDWAANNQTVLMSSHAPNGLPVILEVDQTGKAKVILQGNVNIDFAWMIQSPDRRYGLLAEVIPSDSNAWIVMTSEANGSF